MKIKITVEKIKTKQIKMIKKTLLVFFVFTTRSKIPVINHLSPVIPRGGGAEPLSWRAGGWGHLVLAWWDVAACAGCCCAPLLNKYLNS